MGSKRRKPTTSKRKKIIPRSVVTYSILAAVITTATIAITLFYQSDQPISKQTNATIHEARIIGGNEAKRDSWPFTVRVLYTETWEAGHLFWKDLKEVTYYCGGSLISDTWVITAAHCLEDKHKRVINKRVVVYLGSHGDYGKDGTSYNIKQYIMHPSFHNYKRYTVDDIALIELGDPVIKGIPTESISLPDEQLLDTLIQQNEDRIPAMAIGWGYVNSQDKVAEFLQETMLRMQPLDHNIRNTSDNMIATEPYDVNCPTWTCKGDSGGPLITWNTQKNIWVLVGIASWYTPHIGRPLCQSKKSSGMFAKVGMYTQWIEKHTGITPNQGTFKGSPPITPTPCPDAT